MATNSKIEWTHHTDNLWWGCTEVHSGCDNCYARIWANRYGVKWGNNAPRREVKSVWGNFLTQQAKAAAAGEIHRVFVGSMMDIFENPMPLSNTAGAVYEYPKLTNTLRERFFLEIVPNCPNLLFLLLTKRPSNINRMIPQEWDNNPPKNVMFGASVVDTKTAVSIHRQLSKVNGLKFYSVEPQLEFIDFSKKGLLDGIDWVIQGGESGPKKRPFSTDWARHTRDVCAQLNVPYFFKQVDKIQPIPDDLLIRQFPNTQHG
jgi:protein gp37